MQAGGATAVPQQGEARGALVVSQHVAMGGGLLPTGRALVHPPAVSGVWLLTLDTHRA